MNFRSHTRAPIDSGLRSLVVALLLCWSYSKVTSPSIQQVPSKIANQKIANAATAVRVAQVRSVLRISVHTHSSSTGPRGLAAQQTQKSTRGPYGRFSGQPIKQCCSAVDFDGMVARCRLRGGDLGVIDREGSDLAVQ